MGKAAVGQCVCKHSELFNGSEPTVQKPVSEAQICGWVARGLSSRLREPQCGPLEKGGLRSCI